MKFAVCTLGCKVNTYESEYVINVLKKAGYELVDYEDKADIYIINTCTVTNTSDQKSRKMIRQAKKKNKDAIVIAMGCYVQNKKNYESILDDVDILIGNSNKTEILRLIDSFKNKKEKIIDIQDVSKSSFEDMEISKFNTRTRALLKIQDGCENFCSYCIIPYVRGKVRSKDKDAVLKEACFLAQSGYKEIVLTGIHTGHYGLDLSEYDFSDLLKDLNEIDGLERIRISSIEITELNDKFLDVLKNCKAIVNHIHIPLQSGTDEILKKMNRKYDTKYFLDKINKIREIRPDIAITTDVIVGFPYETDDLFEKTVEFIKKVNFAGGHVFPYSIRNGTPAAKMSNQVSKSVKHSRVKKLIEVFNELENNYYNKYIDKDVVVIPEVYEEGYLTGHTDNYLKVTFKGDKSLLKNNVRVHITKNENMILKGKIIE